MAKATERSIQQQRSTVPISMAGIQEFENSEHSVKRKIFSMQDELRAGQQNDMHHYKDSKFHIWIKTRTGVPLHLSLLPVHVLKF